MAFLALRMAGPGQRRRGDALALREHNRLMLFDLYDILATGLMPLGRGGGIAVVRIQGHFARLELCVRSQVAHHRNFTGFAALHGRLGQQGPGGMTDCEPHGLLVPRGEHTPQDLPIDGDPVVRGTPRRLHAKILVDQRVSLCPVQPRQESR